MHHQKGSHAATKHATPETRGSVIRWAGLYDIVAKVMTLGKDSAIRRLTIRLAEVRPGDRVLDVGCGTGTLALMAKAEAGPTGEVSGVDASPEMIDFAQRKAAKAGADIEFRTGLIESLPFTDDHFDLVLSTFMLHHLPDDLKQQGFAEIARVLKRGGRLLAVDLSGRGGSLFWRLLSLAPGHGRHRMPADYVQRLVAMMEGAGLLPEVLGTDEEQFAVIRSRKA